MAKDEPQPGSDRWNDQTIRIKVLKASITQKLEAMDYDKVVCTIWGMLCGMGCPPELAKKIIAAGNKE